MDTNQVQIVNQILSASGHHFTTMELTFLCALPTSIAAHFWALVKFWAHVGGSQGVIRFIKTGSNLPVDSRPQSEQALKPVPPVAANGQ